MSLSNFYNYVAYIIFLFLLISCTKEKNGEDEKNKNIAVKENKDGLYDVAELNKLKKYTSLKEALQNPESVFRLDLKKQNLLEFPKEILRFNNLQELDLGNNSIDSLPSELNQLKKLQILSISKNKFRNIPGIIFQIGHLKDLDVSGLMMNDFPEDLAKLKELTKITADGCGFQKFPLGLCKIKTLERINLNRNQIKNIPKEIAQITALQSLKITENRIDSISGDIANLKELKTLDLSNNLLKVLPVEINQLGKLRSLILDDNQFVRINSAITELKLLQVLSLENNKIQSLPEDMFEKFTNLTSLNIKNNPLKKFPGSIVNYKTTISIDVSKNTEMDLSEFFKLLSKSDAVHTLIMAPFKHKSEQVTIPEEMNQLNNLKSLKISNNQFANPNNVLSLLSTLTALEELDLSNCNIYISKDFEKLKNLKKLILSKNTPETSRKELASILPDTKINYEGI